MSYVGQEDVFHPTSTVKEVVLFHAHLRSVGGVAPGCAVRACHHVWMGR